MVPPGSPFPMARSCHWMAFLFLSALCGHIDGQIPHRYLLGDEGNAHGVASRVFPG